jgi:hypothetical protein
LFCSLPDEEGELTHAFGRIGLHSAESSTSSPFADPSDPNRRRMSLDDFTFIKVLGKGSFGKVCQFILFSVDEKQGMYIACYNVRKMIL